jgi:SP family sugar porter-like MFS transporter
MTTMPNPLPQQVKHLSKPVHHDHAHSGYVWFISFVAALGGLLFGYDWVVIGGAKPFYEVYFNLSTPSLQGWAMSCALIGCLAGALFSGVLSELWGRKPALLVAAFTFTVSSLCTGLAGSLTSFVLWRMAGGIAIGLASSLSPMYIAEVAPAEIRGKLVCLNELTIVLGILSAQIANWLIAKPVADSSAAAILDSWNGQQGWRWMFAATAVPAILFLLGMLFVPESPRWLAMRGRLDEAARTLERIGGSSNARFVLQEIADAKGRTGQGSELRQLLQPRFLRILLLGVALAVLQQWCGINVIFNYAQEIFSAAGYPLSSILFNIVVTGVVMVVFTFVSIATIDRYGRRPLMLIGSGGLAAIYIVLGTLFGLHSQGLPMLALVVAALAFYAMTLAPVTWVILSEIFPGPVRGTAMAIATASLWIACFILTYTFPLLNAVAGTAGTFWIYAAICVLGFLLIHRRLPETRRRTLEEIEESWNQRASRLKS